MPRSQKQWEAVEKNVSEAEKPIRRARRASTEKQAKSPRVAQKAIEQEEYYRNESEALLGNEQSPERALVKFEKKNLIAALREFNRIKAERQELLNEEADILQSLGDTPTEAEQEALADIRKELERIDEAQKALCESNPEAFFGLHLKGLKEYKNDLEKGRIVETPYVKKQVDDIVAHLRANKPVFIYGHLGSGKTELAMHIARKYLGKEALVISGSKNMSMAELYGHQVLAIDKLKKEELDSFINDVAVKFDEWKLSNPDAGEEEMSRAHDRILQVYVAHLKGGTVSDFFLGPVYRAMAEGRPVIIDEVNAIPHEVLISLNHILTRRVGDVVDVQQNSGSKITVQEGFGVMMTGNLNQGQDQYVQRQELDPAFLSRLYTIEHDYLPQTTEGPLEEAQNQDNELFRLLVAEMMDKNGNLAVPADTPRKLWNLVKAARLTQDVFAGRNVQSAYYFREAAGRAVPYFLQKAVLSLRSLNTILTQWKREGFRRELDYYVWKEFVSQSTVASDKAYLYQILKDQFGFFSNPGWEQNPNYGSGGVVNTFAVKPPANAPEDQTFYGPREVVGLVFGEPPERSKWPVEADEIAIAGTESEIEEEDLGQEIMELEEARAALFAEFKKAEQEVKEFVK